MISSATILRAIGFAANRKLLEVERLSHDCILSEDTFQAVNRSLPAASAPRVCASPIRALIGIAQNHRVDGTLKACVGQRPNVAFHNSCLACHL